VIKRTLSVYLNDSLARDVFQHTRSIYFLQKHWTNSTFRSLYRWVCGDNTLTTAVFKKNVTRMYTQVLIPGLVLCQLHYALYSPAQQLPDPTCTHYNILFSLLLLSSISLPMVSEPKTFIQLYSQLCNKCSDKSNWCSLGLSLSVGGLERRRCDKQ